MHSKLNLVDSFFLSFFLCKVSFAVGGMSSFKQFSLKSFLPCLLADRVIDLSRRDCVRACVRFLAQFYCVLLYSVTVLQIDYR